LGHRRGADLGADGHREGAAGHGVLDQGRVPPGRSAYIRTAPLSQ
jgi:hypothetical protein